MAAPSPANATHHRPPHIHFQRKVAAWARWLHVYLSMFCMGIVLFFSVTGVTLNHPNWFVGGLERRDDQEGTMDVRLLDPSGDVDKLAVVEHLRARDRVRGAVADFSVDDREVAITFKGPGYSADAFIDRRSGTYRLTETKHGLVAVLNDLHKGRDTGTTWSLVLDLSAGLLVLVSITGLILLFYLKLRRVAGMVTAVLGALIVVLIVSLLVP